MDLDFCIPVWQKVCPLIFGGPAKVCPLMWERGAPEGAPEGCPLNVPANFWWAPRPQISGHTFAAPPKISGHTFCQTGTQK